MESIEWRTWYDMIRRCENPIATNYKYYGARGISVCERWLNSFSAFLLDMGKKPANHTLDRIDTYGNYEPSNCRWANHFVQQSNKRQVNQLMCKHGHVLDGKRTRAGNGRYCKTCNKLRKRKYRLNDIK